MINYIKSEKGYFYKILNNGEKKRISNIEYQKKNNKIKILKKGGVLNNIIKGKDDIEI